MCRTMLTARRQMSISRGEDITDTVLLKLIFPLLGALTGIAAAGLGFVPPWAIAPFAAGGLLAWGVIEYLSDRPINT